MRLSQRHEKQRTAQGPSPDMFRNLEPLMSFRANAGRLMQYTIPKRAAQTKEREVAVPKRGGERRRLWRVVGVWSESDLNIPFLRCRICSGDLSPMTGKIEKD